jgi:hypothetical protein
MRVERNHLKTERSTSPSSRAWAFIAVLWAWLLLPIGCGASLVTVARGGYDGVLLTAISCAGAAAILLTFAVLRGGMVARIFAALSLVPLVFIVSEFIRRYR